MEDFFASDDSIDASFVGSDFTGGTGSDGVFSNGFRNKDKFQFSWDSFFAPSSLDDDELDTSEPLSLELSLSLIGDLENRAVMS